MQIYEKILSDTDSIYCAKPTNSHQSSVFIGPTDGEITYGLFGSDYCSDMDIVVEFSRDNLLLNLLYHCNEGVKYKKRGGNVDWDLDVNWLIKLVSDIRNVFEKPIEQFHVSVNKETTRTYLKGLANVTTGNGINKLDIRNYLFSGDRLRMKRKENGVIAIAISERGGEDDLFRSEEMSPLSPSHPLPSVDRLAIALKFFAEKRNVDPIEWWASCDEWAKKVRENFAKADAGMFVAEGFDYAGFMHNFVYNVTVANSYFSKHTEEQKTEVGNFLAQNRNSPKAASWYMDESHFPQVGGSKIPGFGSGVALNFMMKVRPSEFATYSSMIDDMLVFAGLLKSPLPKDVTVEAYEQSKSLQGVVMQKMHEMGIGKAADDNSPADYLTVNEFAWWLNNGKNKDLIKEKVMKAQWKPVDSKAKMKNGTKKLKDAMSDDMLKRLAAALRTKPFAILAGHSGTGKSRLVRRLAYMTCNNEMLIEEGKGKSAPGNYCMVQVKPNWHDSTDLLGYYSEMGERHFVNTPFVEFICKAYAYPDTPFFVCLDEMNLAPVEQYFAEYLSAIESMEKKDGVWVTDALVDVDKTEEPGADGKQKASSEIVGQIMKGAASTEAAEWIQAHGLTIPKNLFVVGTVNMDETTCQFSRKVLDRAMTLLMNEVKFSEMANSKKPSEEELLDADGIKFFLEGEGTGAVSGIESGLLDDVNEQLGNTPFVIAYRFANEYALYEAAWAKLSDMDMAAATDDEKKNLAAKALDHVVMMKLLPRIHGERRVVEGIFNGRKDKRADGDKDLPGLKVKLPDGLSAKMMDEILARRDEYLTFWP